MAHGTRISGVNKAVTTGLTRINGVNKKVKKGLTLVNGVQKDILFGGPRLSELATGAVIYMTIDGKRTPLKVVHQGIPSRRYDNSCNGTWVITKDAYEKRQWNTSAANDYAASTVDAYLNGVFFASIDADQAPAVKTVKIPYRPGSGIDATVNTGANGLEVKVFLPAAREVGSTNTSTARDGDKLSYYQSGLGATATRVMEYDGVAVPWVTRTPWLAQDGGYISAVAATGTMYSASVVTYENNYICPMMILDPDASYDENMNVVT